MFSLLREKVGRLMEEGLREGSGWAWRRIRACGWLYVDMLGIGHF